LPAKPIMIGIAGGSCSGKSSIARRVVELAGKPALVLALDSYYHDFSGVREEDIEVDLPEALDGALFARHCRALAEGRRVDKPVYDFATHSRKRTREPIEPGELVIIEGLFALYWPEVRELLDLSVFVTIDHGTALNRRIARDTRERGRTEASVRAQYRDKVRPNFDEFVLPTMETADVVVSGLDPVDVSAREVVSRLPRTG
jgi:uridine kinase